MFVGRPTVAGTDEQDQEVRVGRVRPYPAAAVRAASLSTSRIMR